MSTKPLLNRKALLLFIAFLMAASLATTASTQQMTTIAITIIPMCGDRAGSIGLPLDVRVDGKTVDIDTVGREIPVSIGSHTVSVYANGKPVVIRNVTKTGIGEQGTVFPGGSTSVTFIVGGRSFFRVNTESCPTTRPQPKTDDSASSACEHYEPLITTTANNQGIPADFLCRIIKAEGTLTYAAEKNPATYRALGVNHVSDPNEVIRAMAKLLSNYLRQFGTECLAAAAFDAGPAAVQNYHGVPPYPSTRQFVTRVSGDARACDPIKTENPPAIRATVRALRGDVSMRSQGGSFVDLTATGAQLSQGDDISTGIDGEVTLAFSDGSTVVLNPNTQCNIASLERQLNNVRVRVNLKLGQVEAKIARSQTSIPSFSIRTPNATASVRGTVFKVRYDREAQTTTVAVEEGTVEVASDNSSAVAVSAGQQVQVAQGQVGAVREPTLEEKNLNALKDMIRRYEEPEFSLRANVTLEGGDYRSFDVTDGGSEVCRSACATEPSCKAYTYLRPGTVEPGAKASCRLKSTVPAETTNSCCVSGVKSGSTSP